MDFNSSLGLLVWILCVHVNRGESCQCPPEHPQEKFCRADFVIKGTVLNNEQLAKIYAGAHWNMTHIEPRTAFKEHQHHHIRIDTVYKGKNVIGEHSITQLFLVDPTPTCHLNPLIMGRSYLISGSQVNETLQSGLCDWISPYKNVTRKQRQSLKHFYKQNCMKCQIHHCFIKNQCLHKFPNQCLYDTSHTIIGYEDCQGRHSRCIRFGNGRCGWANSLHLKECLETNQEKLERLRIGFK